MKINIKDIKHLNESLKNWLLLSEENEHEYTEDSGLNPNAKIKSYNFSSLKYFGNCKNTVDIDKMWDATQMAKVIYDSNVVSFECAKDKLMDGDRPIPKKVLKWITKNSDKLNNKSEIVCGYNETQRIFFIYISDFDIHFFFDGKF